MTRVVIVFVVSMFIVSNAEAQLPGIDLVLAPRIGAFTPLSDLEEGQGTATKIKSGLGLGFSVELDIPASPINLRANLDATIDRDLETGGAAFGKVDVLNLTGDLVLRPLPRVIVLQPYLLAGAGTKRYTFKDPQFDLSESQSSFTGHLGVGVDLKLPSFGALAEISDYISSYEASPGNKKLQNDIFIMVGIRIGLL